jgi:hypothetical protein
LNAIVQLRDWKKDAMRKSQIKTIDVPQAGRRYFGLSRGGSYAAAARGDFPTIRIGHKIFVPVEALERMLAEARPRKRED